MSQLSTISLQQGSKLSMTDATGQPTFVEQFGVGNAPSGKFEIANGTGDGCATKLYRNDFSIAAAGTLFIDLFDGTGSPKDVLGGALSLSKVKWLYIQLDAPGTGNSIVFGPSGNASCSNLSFGNNAMNMTITNGFELRSTAGVTITTGAGYLRLNNPGAGTVTGKLRVIGN